MRSIGGAKGWAAGASVALAAVCACGEDSVTSGASSAASGGTGAAAPGSGGASGGTGGEVGAGAAGGGAAPGGAGGEAPVSCTDGVKNGAETDVDCGGICAAKCGEGQGCGDTADCEIGSCERDKCTVGNVVLLMHFDGPDASVLFEDELGHAIAAVGSPLISATESKFGGTSLMLTNSSRLEVATSSDFDFDTRDFTIEWWELRTDYSPGPGKGFGPAIAGDTQSTFAFLLGLRDVQIYMASAETSDWSVLNGESSFVSSTQEWTHRAVSRTGEVFSSFSDGVKIHEWSSALPLWRDTALPLSIGFGGEYFDGYIDELRITMDVGRYSDDFTPPAAAFPAP